MKPRFRLFIACPLPQDCLHFLMETQGSMSGMFSCARPVQPEQMHLTLRFIGGTDEAGKAAATAWFAGLSFPKLNDFPCLHRGYGVFPGRSGGTVYAGLTMPPEWMRFRLDLENGLRGLGFSGDDRPFLAHITLFRNAVPREEQRCLPDDLNTFPRQIKWPSAVLYQSEFCPSGVVHHPVVIRSL